MREFLAILIVVFLILAITSCEQAETVESIISIESSEEFSSILESSSDEISENTQSSDSIPTDPATGLPVYVPGSIKLYPYDEEIYPNGKPYRDCWYKDPTIFDIGLNNEDISDFISHANLYPERMLCVQYIEYFNIPKEVFVAEVERVRKFYESFVADMSIEERELPNADILYTFDDETINHYYRYE